MNVGDTAWVLMSTGLVTVMVPGLALFYGGLVSSRNVLVMLQQNIFPLGLISIQPPPAPPAPSSRRRGRVRAASCVWPCRTGRPPPCTGRTPVRPS